MRQDLKYKIKKILSSKTAVLGLAVILVLVAFSSLKNLSSQKIVNRQTTELSEEIKEIKEQNLELSDLIKYFSTSEFIEKEARQKLNLGQPGEK